MPFFGPTLTYFKVDHISHEKRLHRKVHQLIKSNQHEGSSSDNADTIYLDDHDFESGESFLRLLGTDEIYVSEEKDDASARDDSILRCRSCVQLQSLLDKTISPIVSMRELKRHVRAK